MRTKILIWLTARFLDCVLDSENLALFERIIANEHWKEQHPEHTSEDWLQKCEAIVDALEELHLPEKRRNEFLLNCERLVKTYPRGAFKLGPISFSIRPGQLIGLVGENGNGKTTLLRILAKEIGYDEGDLHYHNEGDFQNDYDHRTKLVYIPQRTQNGMEKSERICVFVPRIMASWVATTNFW